MKIQQIFSQNIQSNPIKNNKSLERKSFTQSTSRSLNLEKDSFCNSAKKVSFKGAEGDIIKFSKLMDEVAQKHPNSKPALAKDLTNLFQKVFEYVTKAPENFISCGCKNNVFKIDDKYVLRAEKQLKTEDIRDKKIEISDDDLTINSLKTYYGASLAQSHDMKLTVLKNADSNRDAIPLGKAYDKTHGKECVDKSVEENFKKSVKKLAAIPQEAYDNVACDMTILEYSWPPMFFDYMNPNNFLLVKNEIRVVDDLNDSACLGGNNLASMLKVFLTNAQVNSPAEFDSELLGARQNILKKCILSGEKNNLPLDSYDMATVFSKALKLCGYNEEQPLLKNIIKSRNEIIGTGKRMSAVKEFLDNIQKNG